VSSIEYTKQYLKDLKLAIKRNLDEQKLNSVIKILITGEKLPSHNKDHNLTGIYKGLNECHVSPDWLLIYSKNITIKLITLIRTGTHSDLYN
jgi:mRNA interferase YafQ